MAKPDWGALQNQFLADHAKNGISPKEWCEEQGLNYASARRYIKKPAAQSAQKTAQKKLRSAHAQNGAKTPIPQIENQIDSNCLPPGNTADEWSLNPDEYGLNDMQVRFVSEYLIDMNRVAAYKRAGGKGEGNTAYVAASRMYRNDKVSRGFAMPWPQENDAPKLRRTPC